MPAGSDRRLAGALNFAVQVVGSLCLLLAGVEGVALLLAGCVLMGLGVGNLISLPPLIAQAEFARADAGRVGALVTAVNQAAYAFAPAGFGLLRDATGAGAAVFALAAALQVAAALILLRRGRSAMRCGGTSGHARSRFPPHTARPWHPRRAAPTCAAPQRRLRWTIFCRCSAGLRCWRWGASCWCAARCRSPSASVSRRC